MTGVAPERHRAAVIGAGPSGFYTAEHLLTAGVSVDLYDALPTPYGLVRAGVAPDHPKIKSVTRAFDKIAAHEHFRFFGGVELGRDISRAELLVGYDAVVYAVGAAADRRLAITGETLAGSVAATDFVAWYNGHPDHAHHTFDLSCPRVVVIGNGNVAMDVARMLMLDADELAPTDVADHALAALAASNVEEVIILGRRGPAQAAFTTPELRELGHLRQASVMIHEPEALSLAIDEEMPATVARNLALLAEYSAAPISDKPRRIEFRFLRSPVEILGPGSVTGVRVARNRLEGGSAVCTAEEELIPCGLVVRAVGYRGTPLDGVPFEPARGIIRNVGGRVTDAAGDVLPGEYVVGWIKRGPSGVIGTNKKDAADTADRILEDLAGGALPRPRLAAGPPSTSPFALTPVTWAGWQAIDAHERAAGARQARPRVKLVSVPEMLELARANPAAHA
jgi:ferredoxin/flavodoxin---NADP+ reductase